MNFETRIGGGALDDAADLSDEQLLALASDGDSAAFGRLYDRHKAKVLGAALRMLGDWHDAEDAAAAVFLEAWRHRTSIRFVGGTARPWLLVTTMNVARNLRRARSRYDQLLRTLPLEIQEGDHHRVDEELDRLAKRGTTWEAFGALARGEQEALLLCVVEGLTVTEAAKALGASVGTVKSRLSRGKAHLTERLARSDDGASVTLATETLGGGSHA